jgi:hypothetical protein
VCLCPARRGPSAPRENLSAGPPRTARHASGPSEAPVPPHAITVMIGVPMGGTAGDYGGTAVGVEKQARRKLRNSGDRRLLRDSGCQSIHACTSSNTPHPSPFSRTCKHVRGRHLLPQREKGERSIAAPAHHADVGDWGEHRCRFPPSPLVGEGGSARSAATDEGCRKGRRLRMVCRCRTNPCRRKTPACASAAVLVVRFQHLHPICISHQANVGNKRTTSKFMILVEFLNLTFDPEADIKRVSNVKFIPLTSALSAD